MENSHKFYRNTACTYFPCHEVENVEEFNCKFCYCPLYFLEECGGNYIIDDGIKNCKNCIIPHIAGGYDRINKKIIEENTKRRVAK